MNPTDREQILRRIVVAIDGPSGSGKTTTARGVARRLGLRHLDTGAMYRCVALRVARDGADPEDAAAVSAIAGRIDIGFGELEGGAQSVIMDGEDVTSDIRTPEVTATVSRVSAHPGVRHAMVRRQRHLADEGGAVLEGRDIGSVVLPGADVKIYLDANLEVRAHRRFHEFEQRGVKKEIDDVRRDLETRDMLDSTREVSPLRIPAGARIIDTSGLSIEEQVTRVVLAAERSAERIAGLIVAPGEPNPYESRRFVWRLGRSFIKSILVLFWGLRIRRKDNARYRENFIYASNHRSNADPPLVGSTVPGEVHFVAKEALFTFNRAFAKLITTYNAMPIRRNMFDRGAMSGCLELLGKGRSVLIFPEGGRKPGPDLGNSRPGVGYLALQSGCTVVPTYVDGTASLTKSLLRRPPLTVCYGRPIRLDPECLERYRNADGYRDFGDIVLAAIQSLKDELDTD